MNVDGKPYRTILEDDGKVMIIDQRQLPHRFETEELSDVTEVYNAIKDMHVRGAGLIGATAGYGMFIAARNSPRDASVAEFRHNMGLIGDYLKTARPTAVNLAWAVDRQLEVMSRGQSIGEIVTFAGTEARKIADEDSDMCSTIGDFGQSIIASIYKMKLSMGVEDPTVNILTHCNAGWLAFVDWGSATAPIYKAFNAEIPVHVWVDETRPRNQGARLTAWELGQHGVPHHVIADNTGGHLMQHDLVDMCIVGTDRTTRTGDVANKIGTYLKALAAQDNGVPFYVALPSSTFDWNVRDGVREIPIEERSQFEVKTYKWGSDVDTGEPRTVLLTPKGSPAANYAFDVTPARLVTGLITERGVISPVNEDNILKLFPEHK